MADAHFLYIVMAVVLVGLVGWVVAVNIWAPRREPAALAPAPPSDSTK